MFATYTVTFTVFICWNIDIGKLSPSYFILSKNTLQKYQNGYIHIAYMKCIIKEQILYIANTYCYDELFKSYISRKIGNKTFLFCSFFSSIFFYELRKIYHLPENINMYHLSLDVISNKLTTLVWRQELIF